MQAGGRTRGALALLDDLTTREREILRLIAEGRSNGAISETLVLSGKTVETHIRNLYGKLGLNSADDCHRRVQAALIQIEARTETPVVRLAA